MEILRVQVLNKSAGRHFSTKLIKVQVLNKSMQVGIFQKINKICYIIIKDARVPIYLFDLFHGCLLTYETFQNSSNGNL